MDAHEAFPFLKDTILFLSMAGVLIPLLSRLKINPVLGFLAAGVLVGPHGIGTLEDRWSWLSWFTFTDEAEVAHLAELGVVFLMFVIGLEMSIERLWSMRRLVFGLGGLQVAATAAAIFGIARLFGNAVEASAILGLVLAFSSTAIVMQLLVQRGELGTRLGQASFAILLFQDLAVVPLLVLLGILGSGPQGGSFAVMLATAVLKAGATVGLIYVAGQRVIRPLFRQIAADRQPDTFMALTLLTTLGVAALTWVAGLSMALGALLAGLLIAETEFRHEVEVTIEPFKGLLMGVFFLSVGMALDLRALVAAPLLLPASVLGLLAIKTVVLFVLLRVFGLGKGKALEGGLLLGQGSEFAFIVIGLALQLRLLPRDVGQFMLVVVGFSMFAAPLAARLGRALGDAIDRSRVLREEDPGEEFSGLEGHVIVAGFGRVGQMVGEILARQRVPFVAVESDTRLVAAHRRAGLPLVFGDASRPELLRRLHLERAGAVVLTMDSTAGAIHAVQGIRRLAPAVRVVARARDEKHALKLREAGATAVVPETLESGLQMSGLVLESLGVPVEAATRLIEQERERRIEALRGD